MEDGHEGASGVYSQTNLGIPWYWFGFRLLVEIVCIGPGRHSIAITRHKIADTHEALAATSGFPWHYRAGHELARVSANAFGTCRIDLKAPFLPAQIAPGVCSAQLEPGVRQRDRLSSAKAVVMSADANRFRELGCRNAKTQYPNCDHSQIETHALAKPLP